MSLLTVKDLSVNFHTREGTVKAVDNISFNIDRGETLGIVGESGSGKSVACNSLLGLIPEPPGEVSPGRALFKNIDLLACDKNLLRELRGNRITMIFQDPMTALNPYLTIETQLLEPLLYHKKLDKPSAQKKIITVMEEVGIDLAEKRLKLYPHEFSGGMRQRVLIAMALITEPDLLIADEPTTALDVTIQAQILELLQTLQKRYNIGVIFISHDLAIVSQVAQRVLVMNEGQIVEQGSVKEILIQPQHEYTQKLLAAIPSGPKPGNYHFNGTDLPPILELNNVSTSYHNNNNWLSNSKNQIKVIDDIDIQIKQGEILGLVGESGCGKSTLSRTIMCLIKQDHGNIKFQNEDITTLDAKSLKPLRKDFQMIFQDPYASLNPRMSVYQTLYEPLKLNDAVNKESIEQRILELLLEVGLQATDMRKYPHEFSGGQRQRIAIARALAPEPKLLIADEPVSALDVTIQSQILTLLLELNKRYQLSMLFISHDLSVIRYLADRTAVMYQGKIVEIDETETIFTEPKNSYTQSLLSAVPAFGT